MIRRVPVITNTNDDLLLSHQTGRPDPLAVPERGQQDRIVSEIAALRTKVLPDADSHSTGPEMQSAAEAEGSREVRTVGRLGTLCGLSESTTR